MKVPPWDFVWWTWGRWESDEVINAQGHFEACLHPSCERTWRLYSVGGISMIWANKFLLLKRLGVGLLSLKVGSPGLCLA